MRILVTGCHGYIGTVMVPMLRAEGHDVVGLDTDYFKHCHLGPPPREFRYLACDIRDVPESSLEGIDAVFHLAALSNDPLGDIDETLTREINHHASVRLAELAKNAGVSRFVFASSCSSYGAASDEFLSETAALNPVTAYGITKVRTEFDLSRMADPSFSPTCLRNATAYGVSPRLRLDIVINDFVATAFATGQILIKSDGKAWRPVVHVEDICRAFLAVLNAPREQIHNQVFNVGRNEDNYRVRDLAEIVRSTIPGSEVHYEVDGSPDKRTYRVDCRKLPSRVPGFKPRWTVPSGVQQLYDAFRRHAFTVADLHSPRYRRLPSLGQLVDEGHLRDDMRWHQPRGASALPQVA